MLFFTLQSFLSSAVAYVLPITVGVGIAIGLLVRPKVLLGVMAALIGVAFAAGYLVAPTGACAIYW